MPGVKQVIAVRKDLNMRRGKMAAQVAHASMQFLLENNQGEDLTHLNVELNPVEIEWFNTGHAKIVVSVDSEDELRDLIFLAKIKNIEVNEIIDQGRTEFHGVPTLTCAAFGPERSEIIDEVTKHLKLL